jgi:tRNA pseudouridine32 synthase/23S rRNA pseudouridine746 synthase
LLDYLCSRFPAVSAEQWQQRFAQPAVFDDSGRPLNAETPFRAGLRVHYFRSVIDEPQVPWTEDVLFQDEHLVVADKPHFLPVVPAGRHVHETLLGRLKRRLGIDTLAPLHRIDRDTAGLVLFSVRASERDDYQRLFRERRVAKTYEALARLHAGVQLPLLRRSCLAESSAFMQMEEACGPVNAETSIERADATPLQDGEIARFLLYPLTGQKHQLRVHMAALGMPIINDRIYPTLLPDRAGGDDFTGPLQLLARRIEFDDPVTGTRRVFESRRRLEYSGADLE